MKRFLILIPLIALLLSSEIALAGGTRLTRNDYIEMWKDEAIYQMVTHKIPASITLAQGILESADGNSELAKKANNHFGIKCHSDWTGKRAYHDDDRKGECFRHYKDARESFQDHSEFLQKKRYASLFELRINDYKGWAKGLKKCGYATNKQYANLLIRIIEENDLHKFDKIGEGYIKKGEIPKGFIEDEPLAVNNKAENTSPKKKRKGNNEGIPSEINLGSQRAQNLSDNNIRYTTGKSGDTVESLAQELEMMPWQIKKYNDLGSRTNLIEGETIYLQPKRSRSRTASVHTVQEAENIRTISQKYGVKIKKLLQRNGLEENAVLKAGMKLKLR